MELPHQAMGYDRAITTFAPDGRILQVEYAKQAVRSGSTAIGLIIKDGVVLVADKRIISRLIVPESIEKIHIIDDHILATFSGYISDGRVLIERAQVLAQNHKIYFGTPIDLKTLVKDLSDLMQMYTQYGGLRPFGVSLIFAGIIDGKPELYVIEPSGVYYQYYAAVMGEGENKIWNILERKYKKDMELNDAVKLALYSMKKTLNNEFDINRIDVAYLTKKDNKIKFMEREKLLELYNQIEEVKEGNKEGGKEA